MKKLSKGAAAIAAGTALLMSGAGSLAYWQSSASGGGATLTAGTLDITAGSAGVWRDGGTAVDSTTRIKPGDTLTYTQQFTVDATGSGMYAKAAIDPGSLTAGTDSAWATQLVATATYSLTGTGIAPSATAGVFKVTPQSSPITATLTVTIPWDFGSTGDQTGAGDTLTLAATTVTVTQLTTPVPPPTCVSNGNGTLTIAADVPDPENGWYIADVYQGGTYLNGFLETGHPVPAAFILKPPSFISSDGTYTVKVAEGGDASTVYAETTILVSGGGTVYACGS
jgi:alternate signal-mediated exported protein